MGEFERAPRPDREGGMMIEKVKDLGLTDGDWIRVKERGNWSREPMKYTGLNESDGAIEATIPNQNRDVMIPLANVEDISIMHKATKKDDEPQVG